MPPDHEVRVRAEALHVVPAADHHVVGGGELADDVRQVSGQLVAVRVTERRLHLEDGPHGVADHVVQLARLGLRGLRVLGLCGGWSLGHLAIVANASR